MFYIVKLYNNNIIMYVLGYHANIIKLIQYSGEVVCWSKNKKKVVLILLGI